MYNSGQQPVTDPRILVYSVDNETYCRFLKAKLGLAPNCLSIRREEPTAHLTHLCPLKNVRLFGIVC